MKHDDAFLSIAKEAALQAGAYLKQAFLQKEEMDVKEKGYKQIVTHQDFRSQEIILSHLSQFKDHDIISEEKVGEEHTASYVWYVDPLDGTTNFAHGYPHFSVSIALQYHSDTILGVVYIPFTDELFLAEKGKGAFLYEQAIEVSKKDILQDCLIGIAEGEQTAEFEKSIQLFSALRTTNTFRQYGSVAIDLCKVAQGNLDAIFVHGVRPWDVLAGNLLVQEAGGMIRDFSFQSWSRETSSYIACTPAIMDKLLSQVKE